MLHLSSSTQRLRQRRSTFTCIVGVAVVRTTLHYTVDDSQHHHFVAYQATADERLAQGVSAGDRSTGLPLNPEMVKKARELEMQYMEELNFLEDSDRDACVAETGRPPIPTDWIDINKGESLRPNYRKRLVCSDTRGRSTIDVEDWAATFVATPPCEAFK